MDDIAPEDVTSSRAFLYVLGRLMVQGEPMISIIIPVYKVEPYLRQCVDSVLRQTYRDIEILLIDDGSPDRCGEICDEYAEKDVRVRVFHTENRGLSAARNLGLKESSGDYIGFVDSDDWIEPDMYEVLLRRIEETGADVSVCGLWHEFIKSNTKSSCIEAVYDSNEAIYMLICGDFKDLVMNKLWVRKLAVQFQFPEGRVYEDIFTVYKVLQKTQKVAMVNKPLYHYRQRKGSIARTYPMQNLIDCWDAIHDRYDTLILHGRVIQSPDFDYELRKQCANAIGRTWRWFYGVSKEERDYGFLRELNVFTTENYPLLGDKRWPLALRICILLAHSLNKLSLGTSFVLNCILWNAKIGHSLWT